MPCQTENKISHTSGKWRVCENGEWRLATRQEKKDFDLNNKSVRQEFSLVETKDEVTRTAKGLPKKKRTGIQFNQALEESLQGGMEKK